MLIYNTLTGTLALVYSVTVLLFQRALPAQSQAGFILSALLVAFLFTPLRRHIQRDIDRRFFRRKYDAEKILSAFSSGLREQVDLDQVSERLTAVVVETMQPESVSLWLKSRPERESPPEGTGGMGAASAIGR